MRFYIPSQTLYIGSLLFQRYNFRRKLAARKFATSHLDSAALEIDCSDKQVLRIICKSLFCSTLYIFCFMLAFWCSAM